MRWGLRDVRRGNGIGNGEEKGRETRDDTAGRVRTCVQGPLQAVCA